MKARITELEGLLTDSVTRRKAATTELEQIKARASKAEGDLRMRASVDTVAQAIPLAHRQAAIDALHRLQNEGAIDLRGEDREAVLKAANEVLKKSYASYFEEPTRAPNIPGVNPNGVNVQKMGVFNDKGERVL